MLSKETLDRLKKAESNQNHYLPAEHVKREIGEVSLFMVVGPAAVGKTTLMKAASKLNPDIGLVSVFTTRQLRSDDDPGLFRYIDKTDDQVNSILSEIEDRRVVQYAIHPTTGDIYGSHTSDYAYRYNVLATLSSVADGMKRLPFQETKTIGIVSDPEAWIGWLSNRYSNDSNEKTKRLGEAAISIKWLLDHDPAGILWVYNQPYSLVDSAKDMVRVITEESDSAVNGRRLAERMLRVAEKLGGQQ